VLLSIIIPVFNLENYIIRTLDTLRHESKEIEIIIVDDGSTDYSIALIQDYIRHYPDMNIRLFSKQNGGVSSARNFGMKESKGEYLLFLDGDDLLNERALSAILDSIKINQSDIIFWPYFVAEDNGQIINRPKFKILPGYSANGAAALSSLIQERSLYLVIGNAVYSRKLLQTYDLSFSAGCVAGEDMEFTWKCLSVADNIYYTDLPLLYYVQREGSTIHKYNIRRFDAIFAIERVADFLYQQKQDVNAELILKNEIPLNYMGTYRLCLEQACSNYKYWEISSAVRYVNKDIDATYPGLRERMKRLMQSNRSRCLLSRAAVFSLSPGLYMYIARIKQCFNKQFIGIGR